MTFEDPRITYQCPERMARDLFAQLAASEALRAKEVSRRVAAESKLKPAAPRRAHR